MTPRVFALADTHLSFGRPDRDMVRFGEHWRDHPERIRRNAEARVAADDLLLLPGDLSWATKRRDAEPDLAFLASLPGRKVCVKGNHDFWWESGRPIGHPGLEAPPLVVGDLGIAGTRGWQSPRPGSEDTDRRLLARERDRLAHGLRAIAHCPRKLVMLHYPPHPFLDLLRAAGVDTCVYGHVHRDSLPEDEALALAGDRIDGVACWCVAADRIDFAPVRLPV